MQYFFMIVITLLSSACQLIEEPAQQVKSNYTRGDIVFDAKDIAKTAVKRCEDDTDCSSRNTVKYTLHQVDLASQENVEILQFANMLVSWQDNRTYTCLLPTAPLGKLTLLWNKNTEKNCYMQNNGKDYVQQFVIACLGLAEENWQLKPTADLKNFVCKKDTTEISSACFVSGNTKNCTTSAWPNSIRDIHANVGTAPPSNPPPAEGGGITENTKLKDVKIMAEWKLYGGYGGRSVECSGIEQKTKTFMGTSSKSDVSSDYHEDGTIEEFLTNFGCISNNSAIPVADYRPVAGICVATSMDDLKDGLENCTTQTEYIKITFEAQD